MTTRSEREKAQKLNEQHQAILSKMLREEDNKYCADCEAKGPRWASWNLGVFICIRCAGIHRNLGVHISRVKSVNLDQWTPEQIQSMQDMGNTKARKLYEANLPENFRRPQTDQAVEFFIRDKYEKKKYYDKNAINGLTTSSDVVLPSTSSPSLQAAAEKSKIEKEKEKKKEEKKKEKEPEKIKNIAAFDKVKSPQKKEEHSTDHHASPLKTVEPSIDLLGLDAPAGAAITNGNSSTANSALNDDLDIFGPMVSNPLPSSTTPFTQVTTSKPAASTSATSGDLDLFTEPSSKSEESTKKPLSKDSILSLYSSGTIQQTPATAGMFMGPPQIPFASQPSANFQAFPSMGTQMPPAAMMGPVMGQSMPMMAQNTGMMVNMAMPNGYMGNAQAGVIGLAQNVMGPQAAMPGSAVNPQNMYTMQANQQGQWNMGQMNHQMTAMNLNGPAGMMGFNQSTNTMGAWTGSNTGQTLSTQLWK
ncbi:stromal membrane-associated protein 1 isoform X1 [Erpetoichthys calabaricus]|uniref:stromal membrane-associated protein 1 isoform X1 n=1 Tax=Erpetoichthys calabaricus TaxID=27687 RepID=UPI00109FCD4D|nr:stromal membrane-associated protein 1 isoform X1 [Erpetoichthys calabaricus]